MSALKEQKHYKKLRKIREFNKDTTLKKVRRREFKEKKLREELNEASQEYYEEFESGELASVEIQKSVADLMERVI